MGLGGAKSGNSMIIVSGRIDDDLTKLVFVNIPDAKKKKQCHNFMEASVELLRTDLTCKRSALFCSSFHRGCFPYFEPWLAYL
jgi:hypothetical protein